MSSDEKARRLVGDLQTMIDATLNAEAKIPVVADQLSPQEARVLNTVGRQHCCPMTGIAQRIRLSLSSVTGLIDRLCEKRLVRRGRAADDRRVVQVELTDEGRTLHLAAMEARVAFARELLKPLSAGEQEELVRLLGKAAEGLKTGA